MTELKVNQGFGLFHFFFFFNLDQECAFEMEVLITPTYCVSQSTPGVETGSLPAKLQVVLQERI